MPEAKDAPRDDHLLMFRPTLNDLPELSLPSGATIRHSHPDEGPAWEGIVNAAFPEYPLTFAKMRGDMAYTPERILFLEDEGRPVATASAWRKPDFGAE